MFFLEQCFRDLTLVNRDGMNIVLVKINQILMEKFLKLQDVPRTQVNLFVIQCNDNVYTSTWNVVVINNGVHVYSWCGSSESWLRAE